MASAAVPALAGTRAPEGVARSAGPCGLPDTRPLWVDYADGSVPFRDQVFGKPGIVAGATGATVPAALRKEGALTVHFELKLPAYVGTTVAPLPSTAIDANAQRLLARAVVSTGCDAPMIILNELNGASTITPWSTTNSQYRANVLQLMQDLQAKGALPVLLINSLPYTAAPDAADWWRQVANAGWIVIETYGNGRLVHQQGAILANRTLRTQFRTALASLTSIGISPARLGFMLGFQSVPGTGGREGLQPAAAWLELVKWETLAAKEVAAEVGVASVMSWGWATFSTGTVDPDKAAAACVYLWARDPTLCDGPGAAGSGFDPSVTAGQLTLPAGAECVVGDQAIMTADVDRLAIVTKDRDAAFTALFQRLVESAAGPPVPDDRVLALEKAVILNRFGGSRAAYNAALARSGATVDMARAILADEIRRSQVAAGLKVVAPSAAQVADYYATYANLPVRTVEASPSAPWLAGASRGLAIASFAPPQVFSTPVGRTTTFDALDGRYTIRPLDNATPLGAIPPERVTPAIRAALTGFARYDAYSRWSSTLQQKALDRALCTGDRLPVAQGVDLTLYLPYLAAGLS